MSAPPHIHSPTDPQRTGPAGQEFAPGNSAEPEIPDLLFAHHAAPMPANTVPLGARLAFGSGAAALGIKENGFSVFLLIFYNQVMGLPAGLAGAAILAALAVDALIDPLIGVLTDRTNSRWGRRHPWLYGAAIPIAISWLLLWNPPAGASENFLLLWLFLTAVAVRASLSCTEVPSIALLPEMTRDYHERTAVLRYRFLFGWLGGGGLLLLAYGVFFAGTAATPDASGAMTGATNGFLDRHGYVGFSVTGAVVMALSVLVCALGTHKRYARPSAEIVPHAGPIETLRMMRATLVTNPPYMWLVGAGLFAFALQAVSFALSNYMLTYVWQFSKNGTLAYGVCLFIAAVLSFGLITTISRRLGKRETATVLALGCGISGTLPYLLRFAGLFPESGSPLLLPVYLALTLVTMTFGISMVMAAGSMLADVTEATQLRTGRREEGLLSAGWFLMQKTATGIGIFLSGLVVSAAGLAEGAQPGQVPLDVLDWLTGLTCVIVLFLSAAAAFLFRRFPLTQRHYEDNLRKLADVSGAAAAETGMPPQTIFPE